MFSRWISIKHSNYYPSSKLILYKIIHFPYLSSFLGQLQKQRQKQLSLPKNCFLPIGSIPYVITDFRCSIIIIKRGQLMHPEHTDYYLVYLRVNGCYLWFNVFQIALTVALISFLIMAQYQLAAFLQIFIAFLVALDLLIRYFTDGVSHFTKSWDNRTNLIILLLLATSIASDIIAPETTHHDGGIVAGVFLVGRYVLQMIRLLRLLLESKKALEVTKHQNISLSEHAEQDGGDSSH